MAIDARKRITDFFKVKFLTKVALEIYRIEFMCKATFKSAETIKKFYPF